MTSYFDPLDESCRSPIGAVKCGCEVLFHTYYREGGEAGFSADVCYLHFFRDDGFSQSVPMRRTRDGFFASLKFHEVGLYFYYFSFGERVLGRGPMRRGVLTGGDPECWQITVYAETYETPAWFKGGVMYQIFPDRFAIGGKRREVKPYQILRDDWGGMPSFRPNAFGKVLNNDFFGGNLAGIAEKLDYLAALHVKTIYLNPIFEAYSNHRYDTGDYMKIDGLLGTREDFEALAAAAKRRGIRILLDGVFNHTGDDSRYFNKYGRYDSLGAYQSHDSPYAAWYRFRQFPDLYESWWGIETLPAVNEQSESYREFITGSDGVVQTWMARGAAGYRLDVADELPDSFIRKVRAAVKRADPEGLLIGEVWEDASNKISYGERRTYLLGDELDSVMNYPLKNGIINFMLTGNTAELRETIFMLLDNYPKETRDCLMNLLGTHDTPRILTVLSGRRCADKEEMARLVLTPEERETACKRLHMAAVLQFTIFGVPCIYYGDEVGMEGYSDPFCRGCFPWEEAEVSELAKFYARLGGIRTEIAPDVFSDGDYRELYADSGCLVFARKKGKRAVIVYCNRSSAQYRLRFRGRLYDLLNECAVEDPLPILGESYGILLCEEDTMSDIDTMRDIVH